ncbi:MAG: cupin domain-containing protein [Anaerolineae bacterium]|nr:cupin domain-containing protein [Anaerolineae bacterium]
MIQVRNFQQVKARPAAEGVTMRMAIGPDDGAPFFNMRVFEVQPGRATPHHDHWWEHEVFVLAGRGVVRTGEGDVPLEQGSTVFVPGGEMHQFVNQGDEVLRFICVVPQEWLQGYQQGAPARGDA